MNRVMFFVDGFNLYHSIEDPPPYIKDRRKYHKYKWLNIRKLCECFITKESKIVLIKYFTAYALWRHDSYARHRLFVRALRFIGIDIILGKFRYKDKKCPICKGYFTAHEEKRTDVNIAINLLINAIKDEYDTGIIISADSDLIPAIEAVKSDFPNKKIGAIIPIERRAEELKQITDFHMKIKEKHLISSQFDDIIDIGDNVQLRRPSSWC